MVASLPVTVAALRGAIREFSDPSEYPDSDVQFQIDDATLSLNPAVWGDRLPIAIILWAAHYLALAGTVDRPAGPLTSGVIASKSVGGMSLSYDTGSVTTPGGGSFNMTRYGQRYLTMLNSLAVGGVQI